MIKTTSTLYDILESRTVSFVGSIASVIGLIIVIYQIFSGSKIEFYQKAAYSLLLIIFLAIAFYSILIRSNKQALEKSFYQMHAINHLYRNTLCQMFSEKNTAPDTTTLLQNERTTLEAVCQRIATIYSTLTRRTCTVTLKLLTKGENKLYCETYVRSEMKSTRDDDHPKIFEVKTGANSAFDEALRYIPGRPSYFYSSDLTKNSEYRNQRPNWKSYYKSTLVVPVRYADSSKVGQNDVTDDVGFLCVDSMSRNRLKNGFHVQILCAFADQMFNFVKLMRGNYHIAKKLSP